MRLVRDQPAHPALPAHGEPAELSGTGHSHSCCHSVRQTPPIASQSSVCPCPAVPTGGWSPRPLSYVIGLLSGAEFDQHLSNLGEILHVRPEKRSFSLHQSWGAGFPQELSHSLKSQQELAGQGQSLQALPRILPLSS